MHNVYAYTYNHTVSIHLPHRVDEKPRRVSNVVAVAVPSVTTRDERWRESFPSSAPAAAASSKGATAKKRRKRTRDELRVGASSHEGTSSSMMSGMRAVAATEAHNGDGGDARAAASSSKGAAPVAAKAVATSSGHHVADVVKPNDAAEEASCLVGNEDDMSISQLIAVVEKAQADAGGADNDDESQDDDALCATVEEKEESSSATHAEGSEILTSYCCGLADFRFVRGSALARAKAEEASRDTGAFAGTVHDHYGCKAAMVWLLHSPTKGSATNGVVEFVTSAKTVVIGGKSYALATVRNSSMRTISDIYAAAFRDDEDQWISTTLDAARVKDGWYTAREPTDDDDGKPGVVLDAAVAAAFASCVIIDAYARRHHYIHPRATVGREIRMGIVANEISRVASAYGLKAVMVVGSAGPESVLYDFRQFLASKFEPSMVVKGMDHTVLLNFVFPVTKAVRERAASNDKALERLFAVAYRRAFEIFVWSTRFKPREIPQEKLDGASLRQLAQLARRATEDVVIAELQKYWATDGVKPIVGKDFEHSDWIDSARAMYMGSGSPKTRFDPVRIARLENAGIKFSLSGFEIVSIIQLQAAKDSCELDLDALLRMAHPKLAHVPWTVKTLKCLEQKVNRFNAAGEIRECNQPYKPILVSYGTSGNGKITLVINIAKKLRVLADAFWRIFRNDFKAPQNGPKVLEYALEAFPRFEELLSSKSKGRFDVHVFCETVKNNWDVFRSQQQARYTAARLEYERKRKYTRAW